MDSKKMPVRRRGKSALFEVRARNRGYGALTVLAFVFLANGLESFPLSIKPNLTFDLLSNLN